MLLKSNLTNFTTNNPPTPGITYVIPDICTYLVFKDHVVSAYIAE
jgi:hypothetical protein